MFSNGFCVLASGAAAANGLAGDVWAPRLTRRSAEVTGSNSEVEKELILGTFSVPFGSRK